MAICDGPDEMWTARNQMVANRSGLLFIDYSIRKTITA